MKKNTPTRIATTPSTMAILPRFIETGRRTATTPVPTAAAPKIQPRIETGLTITAMMPTMSATLPIFGLSCLAVFFRASESRRSATSFSELMQFLRGKVPRCRGHGYVYAERRCRHSRMLNERGSELVLRQNGDRCDGAGPVPLRWVTTGAPARYTCGSVVPG